MVTALLLNFEPMATWERIFRALRSLMFILAVYLLPLLVVTSGGEAYGLGHWGKWQGQVEPLKKFSVGEAGIFEAAQCSLSLLLVFIGAHLSKSIRRTLPSRHTYTH